MAGATGAEVQVTAADEEAARVQIQSSSRGLIPVSLGVVAVLVFLASVLGGWLHADAGYGRDLLVTVSAMATIGPFIALAAGSAMKKGTRDLERTMARERHMREESSRRS